MSRQESVPALRVVPVNSAAVRADGDYVLYWMTAARRTRWSFGLDRALWRCRELGKPLVVLEGLRCDHRWASDRFHRFVLDGMADQARRFAAAGVSYLPWLEPSPGAGKGLLAALAARACLVVTDEFPCFFLPRMVAAAGRALPVLLEQVDGNGLLPLRATTREFTAAHSFRRFLQGELPRHLSQAPSADPLARLRLPPAPDLSAVLRRWPAASPALLAGQDDLSALPIDHAVTPVPLRGGEVAGAAVLERFLTRRLTSYPEGRNHPDREAASGLSPYLHFGHVSVHQVFAELVAREGWTPDRLGPRPTGRREGWWGASPAAEAFLDELITWREIGFNTCAVRPKDYDRYESLPAWARQTLEEHQGDPRPHLYTLEQLEAAATSDPLWNAAQRQLAREGVIHNYLRMLWGKKVLEWSPTPREALATLIELNNKYAIDGRNPNSYSGIFWCLGRYDRGWPERAVFGKVRCMTSDSTRRKLELKDYLRRFGA